MIDLQGSRTRHQLSRLSIGRTSNGICPSQVDEPFLLVQMGTMLRFEVAFKLKKNVALVAQY